MQTTNLLADVGVRLVERGYVPVVLRPGSKAPLHNSWPEMAPTANQIQRMADRYPTSGVGLNCRTTPVLDIDVDDAEAVAELLAHAEYLLDGAPPRRVGRAPRAALVFRCSAPFFKRQSTKYRDAEGGQHQLELLGDGQQLAAYGIHPDTGKPYSWPAGDLIDTPADALPELSEWVVEEMFELFEEIAQRKGWVPMKEKGDASVRADRWVDADDLSEDELEFLSAQPRLGWTEGEARYQLAMIPADDRDTWITVGMGLYHEFAGSGEGFELWDEWSQTSGKYDDGPNGVTWERWQSFAGGEGRQLKTARSIRSLAREALNKTPMSLNIDAMLDEAESEVMLDPTPAPTATSTATSTATPEVTPEDEPAAMGLGDLEGLPIASGWLGEGMGPGATHLIEGLLALGQVSMLAAQPNTGKSSLMLDIAFAVAQGMKWRGRNTMQGMVAIAAAESPGSLAYRSKAIRRHFDITTPVPIQSTTGSFEITTPEGQKQFAKHFTRVKKQFPDFVLLPIDTLRNAAPGAKENDNEVMGQIMHFLVKLAQRLNIHIMITHHMTKEGSTFAGAGAIKGAVDTEIVLEKGTDRDGAAGYVVAEVRKQRDLGSTGAEELMYFAIEGVFTGDKNNFGTPVTAAVVTRHLTQRDIDNRRVMEEQEKEEQESERVGLDLELLLEAMAEGHTSYAAIEMASGLSRRRVQQARQLGVDSGRIRLIRGATRMGDRYELVEVDGSEGGES